MRFVRGLLSAWLDWDYQNYSHGFAHTRVHYVTGRRQYRPTPAHPWFDE